MGTSWCLKLPPPWLLVPLFTWDDNKRNIKAPQCLIFARGVRLWTMDSTHDVPVMPKAVPIPQCHHWLYWGQQYILPEGSRFKIRIWQCDYCSSVSLCHINVNGKKRWKPTVAIMSTLTSLAQVNAITTTSDATYADKVGIMTTLGFQRTRLRNAPSICYVSLHDRVIPNNSFIDSTMNRLIKSAEWSDHISYSTKRETEKGFIR